MRERRFFRKAQSPPLTTVCASLGKGLPSPLPLSHTGEGEPLYSPRAFRDEASVSTSRYLLPHRRGEQTILHEPPPREQTLERPCAGSGSDCEPFGHALLRPPLLGQAAAGRVLARSRSRECGTAGGPARSAERARKSGSGARRMRPGPPSSRTRLVRKVPASRSVASGTNPQRRLRAPDAQPRSGLRCGRG